MFELIKSVKSMAALWAWCILAALLYLAFFWDRQGSIAFIVGQAVLGLVGLAREWYIHQHYVREK